MKYVGYYLELTLMFLLRTFSTYVFIHMMILLIALFCKYVLNSGFDSGGHNVISAGLAVYTSMTTIYKIRGQKATMWRKEFGFDLEKKDAN